MLYYKRKTFLKQILEKPHRGNIRDVMIVALPMLLSMSFDTLMTFADRLFLAKLSPELMNAALAGGSAQVMVMTFFNGLIAYSTAQVAQNFGAKQFHNCSKSCTQAAILALVCTPLVLLVKPFVYWLFSLSEVSSVQLEAQTVYFDTLLYGAVLILFRQVFVSFFSGIGKTKIVMVAAFIGLVVNVTMIYLLIFGIGPFPACGILGAAYGTIIGNFATILVLFIQYCREVKHSFFGFSFAFHKELFMELLRKGSASGVEMFLSMFAFQSLILLFHGMGPSVATAATVMFNWDMVAYVPLLGLEVASMSLVGRYVGAKDPAAVRRSVRSAIVIGFVYSVVVAVLFVGFPGFLTDIFRPENDSAGLFAETRPLAITMLRIAFCYVVVEVGLVVFAGALRGAGDTFWVMCVMVILNWLTVLALWLCGYVFALGPVASWVTVVIAFFAFPIALIYRWKSGSWRRLMQQGGIR